MKVHPQPIPAQYPADVRKLCVYLRPGGAGTYLRPASTPTAPATYTRP